MPYTLRNGLSFCQVDGEHFIFLDVANDRYFQLPDQLERAFATHLKTERPGPEADMLFEKGILKHTAAAPDLACHPVALLPTRSALEQPAVPTHLHAAVILEVLAITWWTHQQLKRRAFKKTLDCFNAYRDSRTGPYTASMTEAYAQQLLVAADQFRRARLYIPIDTCCLPDSLAMARFLALHGFHASVVIAVSADPFAAHAWVQVGDMVLNDTVGAAHAYAPIRVI